MDVTLIAMKLRYPFLQIGPSSIPGAGQGLFTRMAIPKDSLVVEYKGRITNWAAVQHDIHNDYLYYVNEDYVIDAKSYKKSLARYANDAEGHQQLEGVMNNCVYYKQGGKVYIKAVKDIPPGAEIFVRYGKDYWAQDLKNKAEEVFKSDFRAKEM